jgi:hypothetical protein
MGAAVLVGHYLLHEFSYVKILFTYGGFLQDANDHCARPDLPAKKAMDRKKRCRAGE